MSYTFDRIENKGIIFNGDCLEIMPDLIKNNVKIDTVICDIPYGTTACKWDSIIPFDKMWENLNALCKGKIVLFCKEPFTSQLINSNIDNYREKIIWLKNKSGNGFGADKRHIDIYEEIVVFGKGTFNPQTWLVDKKEFLTQRKTFKDVLIKNNVYGEITKTLKPDNGTRNPLNIISTAIPIAPSKNKTYSSDIDIRYHPTQKPIKLMEYLVKTYSNENDIILDFTMGSGTTCVACNNLNRKFIGIELNADYYNISKQRLTTFVG